MVTAVSLERVGRVTLMCTNCESSVGFDGGQWPTRFQCPVCGKGWDEAEEVLRSIFEWMDKDSAATVILQEEE